ncbi:hypothetical protein EBT31_12910 [bacterium]|nr:hypothetical protein [bacterium]
MSRDDIYFNPPDTYIRQKPEWTQDIDKHVKAFLKKGGKIYQAEMGESFYAKHYQAGNKHAFVINPNKAREEREK